MVNKSVSGMVREKIERKPEFREIVYTPEHWRLLNELREKARNIMRALAVRGLNTVVHGSIARGDVHEKSDIDVFIPYTIPSFKLEQVLEDSGLRVYSRTIVMATPQNTPKAYYALDPEERVVVSYPLVKPKPRELEFYKFGGMLELDEIERGLRKPGVNKKLVLITPSSRGHFEAPVVGFESYVARVVGVSVETVLERVRVLTRRDEVGRTGVFLKIHVPSNTSVEEALSEEALRNQYLRRLLAGNNVV
jgi:predicted nucleotidyltransferase